MRSYHQVGNRRKGITKETKGVGSRPIEEEFPDRKRFLIEICKEVIHELAHYFGWTDADLERFDDNPDPFGDGFNDLH